MFLGVAACAVSSQSRVPRSYLSPNQTYKVDLAGDLTRPISPLITHTVTFNLFKKGKLSASSHLHSGDGFDDSFEDSYSQHVWVSESIIRFGLDASVSRENADSLVVSNNTDKTIKFLRIDARDMFLLFDMQPHSTVKLSASHQGWISWVTCEGEFADGERIAWDGINFFHKDELGKSLQYCVSIRGSAPQIASPQLDGYKSDGANGKINVPKASNCTP